MAQRDAPRTISYPVSNFIKRTDTRAMSHGPLFWKTYNILKKDMAELDAKGYTGEGFYSRGRSLNSTLPISRPIPESDVPENLCGGSWQRRKQRRRRRAGGRKRKFKGEGIKIGEDESKRRELEGGKTSAKVFPSSLRGPLYSSDYIDAGLVESSQVEEGKGVTRRGSCPTSRRTKAKDAGR